MEMSDQAIAYSGELEVQDGDFSLDADRLIIKNGEVVFVFSGWDGDGPFEAEGVAILLGNGKYVAPKIVVKYQDGTVGDALIQIDAIKSTANFLRCSVKGKWVQGDTWNFSGNLRKFKSK